MIMCEVFADYAKEALELAFPPAPQWSSPNKVALDLPAVKLRQFGEDGSTPTLVIAPYAGHSSIIADYAPGQSLAGTLMDCGLGSVYITDWKSATYKMQDWGIDNYLRTLKAIAVYLGSGQVNLIGLCQGGWLAAMFAALFPRKVRTLVIAGAPIDADAGDGVIKQMAHSLPLGAFKAAVAMGGGLMRGQFMLAGWKAMHPEIHYCSKWYELWGRLDLEVALERDHRFAAWYEHTLDLPGRFYLQAVDKLFQRNLFFKGEFVALGRRINLSDIDCPVCLLAGADDDITPASQVFNAAKFLRGTKHVLLAPGGHVGLFMGRATLAKMLDGNRCVARERHALHLILHWSERGGIDN